MRWKLLSLLACVTLSGCAVVPLSGSFERLTKSTQAAKDAPQIDPSLVAELQPGSQIEIASCHAEDHFAGTVLHASADGVVLVNCVYMERDPSGQEVMKRRIPSHWVPVRRISKIKTIEPAPADFVAPSLKINTSESTEYSHGRMGIEFSM